MKRHLALLICLIGSAISLSAQIDDDQIYYSGVPDAYTLSTGRRWATDELSFCILSVRVIPDQGFMLYGIQREGSLSDDEKAILKQYADKETTASVVFSDGHSAKYNVLVKNTTDPDFADFVSSMQLWLDAYTGDTSETKAQSAMAFLEQDIDRITIGRYVVNIKNTEIKTAWLFTSLMKQKVQIDNENKAQ